MEKKLINDPEYERYKRNYPTFPGMQKSLEILRKGGTQGAYLEAALSDLGTHLGECFQDVITTFHTEESGRVRILLIGLIAEAGLPESLSFLIDQLQADNERVRHWAIIGLENLGTKTARRALWDARSYSLSTPEETSAFRKELDRVLARPDGTEKSGSG